MVPMTSPHYNMGHIHQYRPQMQQEHGPMQQYMALGSSLGSVITMSPVEGQATQISGSMTLEHHHGPG